MAVTEPSATDSLTHPAVIAAAVADAVAWVGEPAVASLLEVSDADEVVAAALEEATLDGVLPQPEAPSNSIASAAIDPDRRQVGCIVTVNGGRGLAGTPGFASPQRRPWRGSAGPRRRPRVRRGRGAPP